MGRMRMASVGCGMLLLALLLATTGSAATGDRPGPAAVLERLRAIARDGDVDGMRRLVHPRKGLRDGGVRVAAREIDRDYLIHTGYLKAARSQRPARCDRAFKRGKARCEIVLSRSNGGFRYTFKATKAGVFLISTSVWDG